MKPQLYTSEVVVGLTMYNDFQLALVFDGNLGSTLDVGARVSGCSRLPFRLPLPSLYTTA